MGGRIFFSRPQPLNQVDLSNKSGEWSIKSTTFHFIQASILFTLNQIKSTGRIKSPRPILFKSRQIKSSELIHSPLVRGLSRPSQNDQPSSDHAGKEKE